MFLQVKALPIEQSLLCKSEGGAAAHWAKLSEAILANVSEYLMSRRSEAQSGYGPTEGTSEPDILCYLTRATERSESATWL
jgi:hypothetical protein